MRKPRYRVNEPGRNQRVLLLVLYVYAEECPSPILIKKTKAFLFSRKLINTKCG